jgi:hypothetical protein
MTRLKTTNGSPVVNGSMNQSSISLLANAQPLQCRQQGYRTLFIWAARFSFVTANNCCNGHLSCRIPPAEIFRAEDVAVSPVLPASSRASPASASPARFAGHPQLALRPDNERI